MNTRINTKHLTNDTQHALVTKYINNKLSQVVNMSNLYEVFRAAFFHPLLMFKQETMLNFGTPAILRIDNITIDLEQTYGSLENAKKLFSTYKDTSLYPEYYLLFIDKTKKTKEAFDSIFNDFSKKLEKVCDAIPYDKNVHFINKITDLKTQLQTDLPTKKITTCLEIHKQLEDKKYNLFPKIQLYNNGENKYNYDVPEGIKNIDNLKTIIHSLYYALLDQFIQENQEEHRTLITLLKLFFLMKKHTNHFSNTGYLDQAIAMFCFAFFRDDEYRSQKLKIANIYLEQNSIISSLKDHLFVQELQSHLTSQQRLGLI